MSTRFPGGLTTAKKTEPMGDFILPTDMSKAHIYTEDFDTYTAADWTVTEVGVATQTLGDKDGGQLVLVNAAADDNSTFQFLNGESFLFETGKKLWFDCRISVNDATQSDLLCGLQIKDTTPLDVSDGVFFIKDDASTTMSLRVEKNNTDTTTTVATMADGVFIRLSFFYDGVDSIKIFADGSQVATSVTTNLPDDEILTISFGVQNGEASAKDAAVDYIMVAKER